MVLGELIPEWHLNWTVWVLYGIYLGPERILISRLLGLCGYYAGTLSLSLDLRMAQSRFVYIVSNPKLTLSMYLEPRGFGRKDPLLPMVESCLYL